MSKAIIIQSRYNRDIHPGVSFTMPTLTQQHFKEECDINNIMKKYAVTGLLPNVAGGIYSDLPDVTDFFALQNYMLSTQDAFMELPSAIRKRFDNDPASLLDFLDNYSNHDEAVSLGLLEKPSIENSEVVAPTSPEPLPPDPQGSSLAGKSGD